MPDTRDMVQSRTDSLDRYADYEYELTRQKVVPFLQDWGIVFDQRSLVDVGCGAGGSSEVFSELGARVTGIDIDPARIDAAVSRKNAKSRPIRYLVGDGAKLAETVRNERFDLVICRDVLEHVADPRHVLSELVAILRPGGRIYISFPPYYSAFGGHQHHPRSMTRFFPWIHLLPRRFFFSMLPPIEDYRDELKSLNRLTIQKMELLLADMKIHVYRREYHIVRPSLHFKYGVPQCRGGFIARIPVLRELLMTGAFYLLGLPPDEKQKN